MAFDRRNKFQRTAGPFFWSSISTLGFTLLVGFGAIDLHKAATTGAGIENYRAAIERIQEDYPLLDDAGALMVMETAIGGVQLTLLLLAALLGVAAAAAHTSYMEDELTMEPTSI